MVIAKSGTERGGASGEAAERTETTSDVIPKFGPWTAAHRADHRAARVSKGISGNPLQ